MYLQYSTLVLLSRKITGCFEDFFSGDDRLHHGHGRALIPQA